MDYTRGEWRINEKADYEIVCGEQILAFCPKGYPKANANLIAAAPELLESLKELVSICGNVPEFINNYSVQFAFDAIAKAEGR